jgi:hypothetical protein
MFIKKLRLFLCLVFSCIGGFGMCTLFHSDAYKKQQAAQMTSPAALKQQAVISAAHYGTKLDSLVQTGNVLTVKVNKSKAAMVQVKSNNKAIEQKVSQLLAAAINDTDTVAKLTDCDSLESSLADLKVATAEKDSLCEDIQNQLEQQVNNKDSTLNVQRQEYNALMLSFDNSLAQQDEMLVQNKYLQKQLNRHIVKNKLLSGGLLALSGIVVFNLLHH